MRAQRREPVSPHLRCWVPAAPGHGTGTLPPVTASAPCLVAEGTGSAGTWVGGPEPREAQTGDTWTTPASALTSDR